MNSMFSCFDAFCAEVLLGKSVTANARAYNTVCVDAHDGVTEKMIGKKSEGKGELTKKTKTKKPQKIRLAPEFDGLDCFDTLVRY